MKKVFAVMMLVSVLVFGAAIGAQAAAGRAISMKVPFAFQAGDTLMPAGQYLFEFPTAGNDALGTIVKISTPDGALCQYLLSQIVSGVKGENKWQVTFTKYGDSYFFAKLRNGQISAQVPKTGSEKKIQAAYHHSLKPIASVELQPVYAKPR